MTVSEQKAKLMKLKAHIPTYVEKMDGKKPLYTCYCIEVTCQHHMGPPETFVVERRYSDFHTFHLQLKAKVRCYSSLGYCLNLHMSKLPCIS